MTLDIPKYFIFDGDKIGDRLACAYLADNEEELVQIDHALRSGLLAAEKMLRARALSMIACGADGITCKGHVDDPGILLKYVLEITMPITFSMGCGNTLREAFISLKYAKASGRSRWATIGNEGEMRVYSVD